MSDLCSWKPLYSVNISALDSQHKKLFGLINQLGAAMDDKVVVAKVLNDLVTYTQSHFTTEETLMEEHHFSYLAAHKAEHDSFTQRVVAFQKEFTAGRVSVSVPLLLFLSEWLRKHIMKTDMQYSGFLNGQGVH
jgi:hemerythrin-like metal-binding protein